MSRQKQSKEQLTERASMAGKDRGDSTFRESRFRVSLGPFASTSSSPRAFSSRGRGRFQRRGMQLNKMNFQELTKLKEQDPATIALTLSCEECCFEEILKEVGGDFECVSLLTSLLAKICSSRTSIQNTLNILVYVQSSSFLSANISAQLAKLPSETNIQIDRITSFLENIISLLKELARRMPHVFSGALGVVVLLERTIGQMKEKLGTHYEKLSLELLQLARMKTSVLEQITKENRRAMLKSQKYEPPDNFREISVLPQHHDLLSDSRPYLRRNRKVGAYSCVDEYLDTQFRLLREDFIQPLREGIEEYINSVRNLRRKCTIRAYSNVRFRRLVCSEDGILYRIKFNVKSLGQVDWSFTKRLNYGSLVCLSHNCFETFFFAVVVQKDEVQQGLIDISFDKFDISFDTFDISPFLTNKDMVMVETPAYFEAYRHVLKGLQNMKDDMPFTQYIVDCETDIEPPMYLNQEDEVLFNMASIMKKELSVCKEFESMLDDTSHSSEKLCQQIQEIEEAPKYRKGTHDNDMPLSQVLGGEHDSLMKRKTLSGTYENTLSNITSEEQYLNMAVSQNSKPGDNEIKQSQVEVLQNTLSPGTDCKQSQIKVPVLDISRWPIAAETRMNQSQFEAFQTALTKEFAIIQGPPGTGKTYVGLKITETLLNNRSSWISDSQPSPLLVVCYTNHALDQFLEGILRFLKGKLIRVGSRSKSESLEKYNLKQYKIELYLDPEKLDNEMKKALQLKDEHRRNFLHCKNDIENYGHMIDETECGICHEKLLKPFMKGHYRSLLQGLANKKARSPILEWLGLYGIGRVGLPSVDVTNESSVRHFVNEIKDKKLSLRGSLLALNVSDFQLEEKEWLKCHGRKLTVKKKREYEITLQKELVSDMIMWNMEADRIWNIWRLSMDQRWRLYRLWIKEYTFYLRSLMDPFQRKCNEKAAMYKEASAQIDKHLLSTAAVIGMTTTGAARHQSVLAEIQPPVIIIEEAAEVLEGHVVTSLSPGCKHLILIGDHQQLRPSANVYELAKRYNLDLSLFERMINNRIPCHCLEVQHRMRPSISRLLRHIYPNLKDHESCLSCDNILGIKENVFFITHSAPETHNQESLSHMNEFEADYLAALCRYLLKQNYQAQCITVLSFYSAQVACLSRKLGKEKEEGLTITAVDNYQGEENDIVLLSLVRSNMEEKIGFLSSDNRICVALSRARKGLYVIGNFTLFSEKNSLWRNIISDLQSVNRLGPGLEIYCQTHAKEHSILVEKAEDFLKSPEGGCMKLCQHKLECGHLCALECHPYDPQHTNYQCRKQCTKVLCNLGHICPLKCFAKCAKCNVVVEKKIQSCGHTQKMPCHLEPKLFKCKEACIKRLSCGHGCGEKCGYDHRCNERVMKSWECGHSAKVPCSTVMDETCPEECFTVLACEHKCSGSCKKCSEGRLHTPCQELCRKSLVCGHLCRGTCSSCPPCTLNCENACPHRICGKKCSEPCPPCKEKCRWKCSHYECSKLCSEECDRPRCNQPCNEDLPCKHKCIGLCGEKCPPYCRICQAKELNDVLSREEDNSEARFIYLVDCGHIVEVKTLDKLFEESIVAAGVSELLKRCPWCETTIRNNLRYGNRIKGILQGIETWKKLQSTEKMQKEKLETEIKKEKVKLFQWRYKGYDCEASLSFLQEISQHMNRVACAVPAVLRQLDWLNDVAELKKKLSSATKHELRAYRLEIRVLEKDLNVFSQWLAKLRLSFSDQDSKDAVMEYSRLRFGVFLLTLPLSLEKHGITLPDGLKVKLGQAQSVVTQKCRLTSEKKTILANLRQEVEELLPISGLKTLKRTDWQ